MRNPDGVFLGKSDKAEYLPLKYANRHGLITGATGTGKTVSLQILAEGLSRAGVPVFCADVKGDLSGLAVAGTAKDFLLERARTIDFADAYKFQAAPTVFWDLFGKKGHPIRTNMTDMGPLLLSRLMDLSEAQEGILNIAFRLADDEGLLLLDMADLRALLKHIGDNYKEISVAYGNVSRASVGAIQRRLLVLEEQGGDKFFGEPAMNISDLMRRDEDGNGMVNVLAADTLMMAPRLYATFLLWLLSELFEELPEVGDSDKPKLVFFFDEAHLLFDEAPKILVDRVEQVVKLIRSKGVGVFFVTQNPLDVPESVLAQLGNRIQHALRAYTPRERKAVKTAADTFRPNPDFDTFEVITQLGVGEALVSVLQKKGVPSVVQRTLIRPPSSRLGPLTDRERKAIIRDSPLHGEYDTTINRRSAEEMLQARAEEKARQEELQRRREDLEREMAGRMRRSRTGYQLPEIGRDDRPTSSSRKRSTTSRSRRKTTTGGILESVVRDVGFSLGRALVRGILGNMKRGF